MFVEQQEAAAEAARFGVAAAIHPDDFIYRHHLDVDERPDRAAVQRDVTRYYFWDGDRSAQTLHALIGRTHPTASTRRLSLLEFASGYGCVSRHLKRMQDSYRLVACDIHPQAVDFLNSAIGVAAIGSVVEPGAFTTPGRSDVVFALSFVSHMPPASFGRRLKALLAVVEEGGILIFTTHGRIGHRNVGQPALLPEGCWFAPLSEQKDLPTEQYGCMIVSPAFVTAQLFALHDAELVLFEEAFWWETQDVFVVRKATGRLGAAMPVQSAPERPSEVCGEPDLLQAEALALVHASTSWRVTRPLRTLGRLLGRG